MADIAYPTEPLAAAQAAAYTGVDRRTLEILEHRRTVGRKRRRGWLVRRMLLAADVVGLVAALALSEAVIAAGGKATFPRVDFILMGLVLPIWILIARTYGLYDSDEERAAHTTVDDLVGVFHVVSVGTWLYFAIAWFLPFAHPYFPQLLLFWGSGIALVTAARASARSYCRRQIAYIQNTVIVGAGDVGQRVARKILQHPEYGLNVVGFVDAEPKDRREGLDHLALLGPADRLVEIVRTYDVERVIFAFSREAAEEDVKLIRELRSWDVQVDLVPRYYDVVGPRVGFHNIEAISLSASRRSSSLVPRARSSAASTSPAR